MTNEEAKKMLKAKLECLKHETSGTDYACNQHLCEGCSLNYEQGNMGEQKEALEMATKALEQQPCKDCISREAVIEDVIKCTDMNEDTMEVLEDKVRALQSVTPKTGHWMTDVYKFGRDRHTCSNCGEGQEYTTPFCSWCGADMREKQAESEGV